MRANPPLLIFGNPGGQHSESHAWREVHRLAKELLQTARLSEGDHHKLDLLMKIAQDMKAQVLRGVHTNPRHRTTKIAEAVQAIVYINATDHQPYAHGFGNADLNEKALKAGRLLMSDLKARTDVCAYGNADGTITLEGKRGQRLWQLFPHERETWP